MRNVLIILCLILTSCSVEKGADKGKMDKDKIEIKINKNLETLINEETVNLREVKIIKTEIAIKVNQDQEILINGEVIALKDINQKITTIISQGTIKKENYIVNFDIPEHSNMKIVTDIKQQLREVGVLNVKYKSE